MLKVTHVRLGKYDKEYLNDSRASQDRLRSRVELLCLGLFWGNATAMGTIAKVSGATIAAIIAEDSDRFISDRTLSQLIDGVGVQKVWLMTGQGLCVSTRIRRQICQSLKQLSPSRKKRPFLHQAGSTEMLSSVTSDMVAKRWRGIITANFSKDKTFASKIGVSSANVVQLTKYGKLATKLVTAIVTYWDTTEDWVRDSIGEPPAAYLEPSAIPDEKTKPVAEQKELAFETDKPAKINGKKYKKLKVSPYKSETRRKVPLSGPRLAKVDKTALAYLQYHTNARKWSMSTRSKILFNFIDRDKETLARFRRYVESIAMADAQGKDQPDVGLHR